MSHRSIRKNLLLYIDGSLGEKDTIEVKKHLPQCPHCSQQITVLSKIWKNGTAIEQLRPSPFLWTKLEARIAQSETPNIVIQKYIPALRYSVAIVLFIISIILGNYIGNLPQSSAQQSSEITSNEYFARTYHLDSFELSSDESIGQVILLTSSERK